METVIPLGIIKYYLHQGNIRDLSSRFRVFDKLCQSVTKGKWHEWTDSHTNEVSLQKLVIFIGKTGYGKSTTVNAIVGRDILKTSAVSACTRECQTMDFHIDGNYWLSLGDLPGVGEDAARDEEYLRLYADFLKYACAIVYILRADARDFSIDQKTFESLLKKHDINKRVIYALGQCDKIEPIERPYTPMPTNRQMQNIEKKLDVVKSIFSPVNRVVPYSAITGWNLNDLIQEIIRVSLDEVY